MFEPRIPEKREEVVPRDPFGYGVSDDEGHVHACVVLTYSEGPFQVALEGFIGVLQRDGASR